MSRKTIYISIGALVGLILLAAAVFPEPARAANTWYVAPGGNDSNGCSSAGTACASIQGALNKAGFISGDTIKIAVGTYTGTGDQVALLSKSTTLSGGWNAGFSSQTGTSTLDGQNARRGVSIASGVTATIDRLSIQNGSSGHGGGGIKSDHANLTVTNSILTNNIAVGNGGAILDTSGTLVVTNSQFTNNRSAFSGGAIYSYQGNATIIDSILRGNTATGNGGAVGSFQGDVTIDHSDISENRGGSAGGGGGGGGGGIGVEGGAMLIVNNSGVTRNTLGGEFNGGGIAILGTLIINNSTISENSGAVNGGGIAVLFGTSSLNNVTVGKNSARGDGGGIYTRGESVTLQNTLVGGNTAAGTGADCNGEISSAGYNLVATTTGCTFSSASGDLTNTDPKLGVVVGSPGYLPLLAGSPAINAGNPGGCVGSAGPLTTDQRGLARVGRCDMGAYEYTTPGAAAFIAVLSGTPQYTAPLEDFSLPLEAIVLDNVGSPVNNVGVTFTAPASGASATFAATGKNSMTTNTAANGVAITSELTANGTLGNYSVSATVGGVGAPAIFSLGNLGWYVKPGGSDANDCNSPASACATINGVLAKPLLREGETILVAAGTFTGTGNEIVLVTKDAKILGGWNPEFTEQNGTTLLDGQGARRGMTVNSGVEASIENFIIENGFAPLGEPGGGLFNQGTLEVADSTIRASHSKGGGAGGIGNTGTMTLVRVLVEENVAEDEGYIVSGGGIGTRGKLTLNGSAVVNNTAAFGGGISASGTVIINNSTIAGNTAVEGGLGGAGITARNATIRLYSSTVSENHGGAGIDLVGGTVKLQNTLLARNDSDCSGFIGSMGHNVIENTKGCTFTPSTGDVVNESAQLEPPGDNGGDMPTSGFARTSPAVDNGEPSGCKNNRHKVLDFDQRGAARKDGDGDSIVRCDTGAFEFDPVVCANVTPEAADLFKPKPDAALKKPKATFAWSSQRCPDEYQLVVKRGSSSGKTILAESLEKIRYKLPGLEFGKKYVWQIAACNTGVCTTSAWQQFRVNEIMSGEWKGNTDQALPLHLNVGGKPLTCDTFVVQIEFPTCTVELTAQGPAKIKKGKLTVGGALGGGSLLFYGKFQDGAHLRGTYEASGVSLQGCGTLTRTGKWSAAWASAASSSGENERRGLADGNWNVK